MRALILVASAVQGLIAVGLLFLLEAIVRAFAPDWSLPFSPWWGLLLALPGLAVARFFVREERRMQETRW